jgi:hypothetical protein
MLSPVPPPAPYKPVHEVRALKSVLQGTWLPSVTRNQPRRTGSLRALDVALTFLLARRRSGCCQKPYRRGVRAGFFQMLLLLAGILVLWWLDRLHHGS